MQKTEQSSYFSFESLDISVVFISILTIWIVHRLTRNREREKYIFELCKSIEAHATTLGELAFLAWSQPRGAGRIKSIAQVRSQLQLIGALVNRLEILTNGWRMRWKFSGPGAINAKIDLSRNLIDLRQSITDDPFDDPDRKANNLKAVESTSNVSIFLLALDLKLRNWIRPI